MSENKHADLAPSGAHKWLNCAGSARLEKIAKERYPEEDSVHAAEGTAAHFLFSEAITQLPRPWIIPEEWTVSRAIIVIDGIACWHEGDTPTGEGYFLFHVTSEMADYVQASLDYLYDCAGEDGVVYAEQRLNIEPTTGEAGAHGTADVVVLRGGELQVHDLKYGMKLVGVENNPQLLIYAAGALDTYGAFEDIDRVTITIHQPRKEYFKAHTFSLEAFNAKRHEINQGATRARIALNLGEDTLDRQGLLVPGDYCSQHYCRAASFCPALKREVQEFEGGAEWTVATGDPTDLAHWAQKVERVVYWADEIMKAVHREVLAGRPVPGFKAVIGKRGNREWDNEQEVEDMLKRMEIRHEVIYKRVLQSPTELEKAAKAGKIGPKQWPKLQARITQAEGRLTVVSESDKREAVVIEAADPLDDFEDISDEVEEPEWLTQ